MRIKTLKVELLNQIVIEDYAWADPGEKIKAGQTSDEAPATESLGALAFGAAGLIAWRKRRAAGT